MITLVSRMLLDATIVLLCISLIKCSMAYLRSEGEIFIVKIGTAIRDAVGEEGVSGESEDRI